MSRHTCKNPSCNCIFEYCRACTFRPVRYKDAGFCSKECYEASKKVVEPTIEEVAIIEIDELLSEENRNETIVSIETLAEATIVKEPIIKKETNAYKKKKK